MAVIFPRWTNRIPLFIGVTAPFALIGVVFAVWYWFSPSYTDVGYQPKQPVPFSHQLHAGSFGMDCRYCHNTVERAAHAAVPPAETCMGCHSQVATASRGLGPIRESYETGEPVRWVRVHMLPDYAYFNHSVHLNANVGCASCHGRIDQMQVVRQVEPLSMSWCLDCHREPAEHLRPEGVSVTDMTWTFSRADEQQREEIYGKAESVNPPEHCSGCHR